MIALSKSVLLPRLCAAIAFLSYLFAGASLALPAELHCARCAKLGTPSTMRAGTSCPLSYHRHDCHNGQKRTAGQIILCPDGCLRHDGQGGEVPSLAKFVSAPLSGLSGWCPTGSATEEISFSLLDSFFSPPYHPPSSRS